MGSGAVIYINDGFISPANFYASDFTFKGTDCGMWQGIVAPGDGRIEFIGGVIEDAENAIEAGSCYLAINCENIIFNNNCISLYYPQNLLGLSSFIDLGGLPGSFYSCKFKSNSLMFLPSFNGQNVIPLDGRPFAGFVLNDIERNVTNDPSIPFNSASTAPCIFENLNYGIYAVNSVVDVFNCEFRNIERSPNYNATEFTSAIFCDNICSYCTTVTSLNVGNSMANHSNLFDNCESSVYAQGEINIDISSNTIFTDVNIVNNRIFDVYLINSSNGNNINLSDNTFRDYMIGFLLSNIANANLTATNNSFYGSTEYEIPQAFMSTAMHISAMSGTELNADISENIFVDSRIGIYLNGVQGFTAAPAFNVHSNYISNDISFYDLENLYTNGFNSYGIWCDNTNYMSIGFNTFTRQHDISVAPVNFDQMLRAINIKQSNFLDIIENDITHFGTPMRFVNNCNETNLKCNFMYSCYGGIFLDIAEMTPQGAANDPWDNKWWYYGYTERISGIANVSGGIDWFHQGNTCTSTCSNEFSPGPHSPFTIAAWPNTTGSVTCSHGSGGGGSQNMILNIAEDSVEYSFYSDESRYYDKEYAYQTLKTDNILLNSDTVLQSFYSIEQLGNIGKFDDVKIDVLNGQNITALTKLNAITPENNIEYNLKYVKSLELQKKISGINSYTTLEKNELDYIGWQTAWEGGDAVFEARRIRMLEVDDQAHNLRVRSKASSPVLNDLKIFPNPSFDFLNFTSEISPNGELRITDIFGKTVLIKKLINGKTIVTGLSPGVYAALLFCNGKLQTSEQFIVIR
jgi:hypothetical protein